MLVLLFVFFILSSAGFLYSTVFQRKYEEALPVCIACIAMLLLVCGILKVLSFGILLVLILTLLTYGFSVFINIKKNSWKQTFSLLFTPGFFIFLAVFVVTGFANSGKLAYEMDAFSHWADVVKSMTLLNDFGTNAASLTEFKSYPPGISLFQYLYQAVGNLLHSGFFFNEGLLYHAYQVAIAAFLVPAFTGFTHKKPLVTIVSAVCVFLAPMFLYYNTYDTLMVDSMLGILSACGMVMLLVAEPDDRFSTLGILSAIIMLVLVKDAGIFFAVILSLGLLLRTLLKDGFKKSSLCALGLSVGAVAVPKLLWELQLLLSGAERSFGNAVDPKVLLRILSGSESSYRGSILSDFMEAYILRGAELRNIGINITYFALLLFSFAALYYLVIYRKKELPDRYFRNTWFLLLFVQTVLYILGLLFAYIFKFNEWEASTLNSFDRYLRIAYQAVFMAIVLLLIYRISKKEEKQTQTGFILFSLIVCTVALGPVVCLFSRENVANTREERAVFDTMTQKIEEYVPQDAPVFIMEADEDYGYAYRGIRFTLRPRKTQHENIRTWCLGGPNNSEDRSYTSEEWQEELDRYFDYVAVYKTDPYFLENYASVFSDPSDIRDESLYRVNHGTKLLEYLG